HLVFHDIRIHCHLPSFPTRRSSDLNKDLAKRDQRLGAKFLRVGLEIGAQLGLLRLRNRVFEQKLHLLAQSATDNRVVLIEAEREDRKSTRLNSSHLVISYAVFCLKK